MGTVDYLDDQLMQLLRQDARQSPNLLAKQLNVSPTTIRRRTNKLIRDGIIRIVGISDPIKLGYSIPALISLDVVHDKLNFVMQKLADKPQISFLSTTTGRYDILALARFKSHEELSSFIEVDLGTLEAVKNIEISICLHVAKSMGLKL